MVPDRRVYDPAHPLGCHRPRIPDRERRNEWIRAGIFARLKKIAPDAYDRIVGLLLRDLGQPGWLLYKRCFYELCLPETTINSLQPMGT